MGLFDKVRSKVTTDSSGRSHVETYARVAPEGVSLQEAADLAASYQAAHEADDVGSQVNAAARLMGAGEFEAALAAWQRIGETHPERRGEALSQTGAARYFLKDYEGALADYVAARDHGFDAAMTDDNVWEACEALHAQGDATAGRRYLEACPDGRYVKKAARL